MLELLRIQNLAIIEELQVEFSGGLIAITGETGAGKSMLLGALKLALGERAAVEQVRSGAKRASVEAVFTVPSGQAHQWIQKSGFEEESEEDRVIIRREILATGNSRNYINNRSATLAQLRALGELLVDMHGQNEHTSLFSTATQLRLLDSYGAYGQQFEAYRASYQKMREAQAQLQKLTMDRGEAERRKSFLEFQVNEIDGASLASGEDEALETERRRLQHAERLLLACATAADLLYEGEKTENPAAVLIAAAEKSLAEVAAFDPSQEQLLKEAEALRYATEDLAERLRDYVATVGVDPQRLATVDERLELIRSLKRKYGASIEQILATREELATELSAIENREESLEKAGEIFRCAAQNALQCAKALTQKRLSAAREFEKRVQREMRDLQLPKAVFRIECTSRLSGDEQNGSEPQIAGLSEEGADQVEFVVLLNPGEEPRPLRKVASGGEISRIMLAIKAVLAERDEIPTLVFDEIDVGISGEAAAKVGSKLKALGHSHQVLCITHLPQIAARGDVHLMVEKRVSDQRTRTAVRNVEGDERASALAQMLSGKEIDDVSRRYAERLLGKTK